MTTTLKNKPTEAGAVPPRPPQEEMQTAYQVHTLAQILYGRIAAPHAWVPIPHEPAPFTSTAGYGPTPWGPQGPDPWAAYGWTVPAAPAAIPPFFAFPR